MSKILILHSGGLRSAVLTSLVTTANEHGVISLGSKNREQFCQKKFSRDNTIALFLHWGQPNANSEMYYSRMFCMALGIQNWYAIMLSKNVGEEFVLESLSFNQNLGLISLNGTPLSSFLGRVIEQAARLFEAEDIVSGEETSSAIFHLCNEKRVRKPIKGLNQSEVVALGRDLGTPMQISTSCIMGAPHACGVCIKCMERFEAFRSNGIEDKIEEINNELV